MTLLEIEQVRVPANNIALDDLRFSDSFTAATNVLAGGSTRHIVRGRSINQPDHATAPYEAADSWMHYDQVGSVIASTKPDGTLQSRRFADAFGNAMNPTNGLWISEAGWGHNTKERDAGMGLVYMYQRWYDSKLGLFMSVAPYPPMMEHEYAFAMQNPLVATDPWGTKPILEKIRDNAGMILGAPCALGYAVGRKPSIYDHIVSNSSNKNFDKEAHCLMACEIERTCGKGSSGIMDDTEIIGHLLQGPVDSIADMHANDVGANAAHNDPCKTCADACKDADKNGKLWTHPMEGFLDGLLGVH